ncbi:MAG: diacylglycerol/lipid kinase family protein [Saccharofermentanales bacterium]
MDRPEMDDSTDRLGLVGIEKYIFILNPTAGKHKSLELKEAILQRFRQENHEDMCIFLFTEKPLHATQIAREQAQLYGNKAIIYACGGDGTVNEVLNGIIGSEAVMSVIPAGTGNDFIKSLYSTRQSSEIISRIFDYKIKKIDAAMLDETYFVNVSSLGFDTIVGDRAKKMVARAKFLGGSAYFLAIFVCLFGKNYSKMNYTFSCVDEAGTESTVSGSKEFVLAAIANGSYYGGMFNPCPGADLSDGLIDVCIVDRISIPEILKMIPKYIKGTHITHPAVHMLKVTGGYMEADGEKLLVNCDGESFVEDNVHLKVVPGAVTVAYY